MNANFVAEMTEVQEALDIWKVQYGENQIPADTLAKTSDVIGNGRIAGEIAYYRIWALSGDKPGASIDLNDSEFNEVYSAELNYLPRGIEDLYYLNTETIGIHTKNKYIIDAQNSMVYSITGNDVNNKKIHSLSMYKMVVSGNDFSPLFNAAEVKLGGNGKIAAGNTEPEYFTNSAGEWVDKDGNKVDKKEDAKNPDYNPDGFRIIASPFSNCIYKLYNNGDLYGKGEKGLQLSSSSEEMSSINSKQYTEFKVPLEIGEYKKVVIGYGTIWVIDTNGDLWAWGSNTSNKMGLNDQQLIEYNTRTPFKLNVAGKKVLNVWEDTNHTFVLTSDNKLYAAGTNTYFNLGVGNNKYTDSFIEVPFKNPENIDMISSTLKEDGWTLIKMKDGSFYGCGIYKELIGRLCKRIFCSIDGWLQIHLYIGYRK